MNRNDQIDLALQATFNEMFKLGFEPRKVVMIDGELGSQIYISIIDPNELPNIPIEYNHDSLSIRIMPESPFLGDPMSNPELYKSYLNFWYGDGSLCEVMIPTSAQLLWYWLYQTIADVNSYNAHSYIIDLFINTPNQDISDSWEFINELAGNAGELVESLLYLVQQSKNEHALNKWIQLVRNCQHIRMGDRHYLQDVVEGTWIYDHIALNKNDIRDEIDHNQWIYEFESNEINQDLDSSLVDK